MNPSSSILIAKNNAEIFLLPQMANRHGLIAGLIRMRRGQSRGKWLPIVSCGIVYGIAAIGLPVYLAYNMNRLAIISTDGGTPRILADKLDRGVSAPRFAPDGSSILFLVADEN